MEERKRKRKKCSASLAGSFNSCASACDCFMGFGWTPSKRLNGPGWRQQRHVPRATWRLVNYAKLAGTLCCANWLSLCVFHFCSVVINCKRKKKKEKRRVKKFAAYFRAGAAKCTLALIRCILSRWVLNRSAAFYFQRAETMLSSLKFSLLCVYFMLFFFEAFPFGKSTAKANWAQRCALI